MNEKIETAVGVFNEGLKHKDIKTIDDLKQIALRIEKMKERDLPKSFSWFARLMAKFGWHRKYEILVFMDNQFSHPFFYNKEKIDI